MIDLLDKLMLDYGFITEKMLDNKLVGFVSISSTRCSHLVVVETSLDALENINLTCDLIFDSLKKTKVWKSAFLKNSILVFLFKDTSVDSSYSLKLIQNVEENKYQFKKHVIAYNDDEFSQFFNELKLSKTTFKKYLTETILDPEKFHYYKKNPSVQTSFSLLVKILVKFPFVEINPSQFAFADLSNLISGKIQNEGLAEYLNFAQVNHRDEESMLKGLVGLAQNEKNKNK